MPRYIDAMKIPYRHMYGDILIAEKDMIDAMPTLSPDEVRGVGKWIGSMAGLRCSICNEPLRLMVGAKNYCPNCGAKMSRAEAEKAMEVSG